MYIIQPVTTITDGKKWGIYLIYFAWKSIRHDENDIAPWVLTIVLASLLLLWSEHYYSQKENASNGQDVIIFDHYCLYIAANYMCKKLLFCKRIM